MLYKKFIVAVIAIVCACGISAQTVVPIVWGFNPGSTQANYIRAITEAANESQKKYQFVFEHKPGAGGAIAMNHLLANKRLALSQVSSSVFTRPLFFPNESYSIDSFQPVITLATAQPIAVYSKKYKSISDLKQAKYLTIGMINGSVVQLVAETLAKNLPNTQLQFVSYPGTPEAMRDVLGDNLDLGIEFAADLSVWTAEGKVTAIGITGTKSHNGLLTLQSQGLQGFEGLVQNYFMVTPNTVDPAVITELNTILKQANKNSKVLELYHRDLIVPADHSLKESKVFWDNLKIYWTKIVKSEK